VKGRARIERAAAFSPEIIHLVAGAKNRATSLRPINPFASVDEVIHRYDYLLFWRDPEGLHFSVQIAALQPKQLGCSCDIPTRFFKFSQDVVTFGGFLYIV
jgi:hypothetical protein